MPSDPRASTEPTLEELNAYVDHELDDAARVRVEQHLATCADCHTRVDGLRQTAHAVRALPMETPPRRFTVPEQRQQSFRWSPVGWLGGAAAALLVIALGIHQLYGLGGTTTTAGSTAFNAAAPASKSAQSAAAQLPGGSQATQLDRSGAAAAANQASVIDPRNGARRLSVMTDAKIYPVNGSLVVTGRVNSDSHVNLDQLRLVLRRGSYGVQLGTPIESSASPTSFAFQASYSLGALALPDPRTGSYTLTVIWSASDGSGATLIAELPVTIQ